MMNCLLIDSVNNLFWKHPPEITTCVAFVRLINKRAFCTNKEANVVWKRADIKLTGTSFVLSCNNASNKE